MNATSRLGARLTLLVLTLIAAIHLQAAPFVSKEFFLKQPDNSKVRVIAWGDEYYQHVESPDGYTLIRDPQTQWICYATYNETKTDYVSTGVRYDGKNAAPAGLSKGIRLGSEIVKSKRIEKKTQLEAKNTSSRSRVSYYDQPNKIVQGTFRGLTLLIDFPDVHATTSQTEMANFFNQVGYTGNGNNGSVRDYFYAVSNGKVSYTNHVTAYYRALQPKSYYDNSTNGKAGELMIEALENLKASGFNFSSLSISGGEIVALNMYYTGFPEAGWAQGLWPHAGNIGHDLGGGIRAGAYQMTNIGANPTLGTVCHENGHMLMKWPDLYDYGGESSGAGGYCLMAYQGPDNNPVPPNPAFRAQAGWQTLTSLNGAANNSVHSVTAGSFTCYKYTHPTMTNEYFVIENIQRTGRWAGMPDEGLAVWHIDEDGSNSDEQMMPEAHYMVSVEQADGLFDLEHDIAHTDGDLFHAGYRDAFTNFSVPNSKWWSELPSSLNLIEISNLASVMTFKYVNTVVSETWVTYQAEDQTWGQSVFETTNGGYTGTGYVNTNNATGSFVNFAVNVPTAKSYQVKWRFANGTTTQRNVEIRVNGNVVVANQPGPGTGAWTTWQEATFTLPLIAGTNNIRFVSLTSGGAPNLDKIEILSEPANRAPIVQNPIQSFTLYKDARDTSFFLPRVFSDPDYDFLSFTATSSNENVTSIYQPSSNTFTIFVNATGQTTITLKATDPHANEVSLQFVVTVLPNERPVVTKNIPGLILCTSFGPYRVDLDTCFSDPDGDPLSFYIENENTGVTASIGTGNILTITPIGSGTGYLRVRAIDNKGSEVSIFSNIKTRTSNSLPVVSTPVPDQVLYHTQRIIIQHDDHYTDADGDKITFEAVNLNSNLIQEFDDDQEEAYYYPQVTSSSPFPVKLKITDGSRCGTATAVFDEFMVTIRQNHDPVVVSPIVSFTINLGSSTTLNLSSVFSDPDGHVLAYYVWAEAVTGTIFSTNFSLSGNMLTINSENLGTDAYYISVDDGYGMKIIYDFRVTVAQSNQPPVVSTILPDRTLTQGASSVSVNLNSYFSDPNGDALTYTITSGSNGNVSISGNTLTINSTTVGTWQVQVQAADGKGGVVSDVFQLIVNPTSATYYCFEAESASNQSTFSPFTVVFDNTVSGSNYIVVPSGGNQSSPPTNSIAAYNFTVPTTATFNIWIRLFAANDTDNNLFIRVDNASYTSISTGTYNSWHWKKWTSKSLTAGSHTLYIGRQEDGLRIDKLLVTKSSTTPTGIGCGAAAPSAREAVEGSSELSVDLIAAPNPVSEELTVALQLPESTNVDLSLYNTLGEKVGVVTSAAYESGEYMFTYQVASLSSGIYILKLQTSSGVITKTIIKN